MSDKHPSWHPKKKKENNGANSKDDGNRRKRDFPELPYDKKVKR